jgi:enoyl-CoA hydratase/carnithine racemase
LLSFWHNDQSIAVILVNVAFMDEKNISLIEGQITELVLQRASRRNALHLPLLRELKDTLAKLETSTTRGLVVRSEGHVFCAGHDFAELAARNRNEMHELLCLCADVMQKLHYLPFPSIAAVQGGALGAGCQLALSCDFVVAADDAYFQTPGGAGGWFCTTPGVAVARHLAPRRALELLVLGQPLSAPKALEWGMINRVVPASELLQQARDFAEQASRGSMVSKSLGKAAFYRQAQLEEAEAYRYASEVMTEAAFLDDAQETFRAFLEKRKPQFRN